MIKVTYYIDRIDDDGSKISFINTIEIEMDSKREEEQELKNLKNQLGNRFIRSTKY